MKKRLLLLAIAIAGCESLGLKDQKRSLIITDCSKPELFVIENKGHPGRASFQIDGNLSHHAQLRWSDSAPKSDSVFSTLNTVDLPAGKVNVSDYGDYYSNKLYVKYIPSNDSTTGNINLTIGSGIPQSRDLQHKSSMELVS